MGGGDATCRPPELQSFVEKQECVEMPDKADTEFKTQKKSRRDERRMH